MGNIRRIACLCALIFPFVGYAAMQSFNYQIPFDSVNTGGGLSNSASYSMEDTAGELATGDSESETFKMKAGYQQMNEVFITLSTTGNITLASIGGVSGGTSIGSTTATVITDSPSGYELTVQASTTPAFKSTNDSFADYVPSGAPDLAFTFTTTQSVFGFTPEGADIASRYRDNGSACNTGSGDTVNACWEGLSTTPRIIAEGVANQPTGVNTRIKVQAGIGSQRMQTAGNYQGFITITALSK